MKLSIHMRCDYLYAMMQSLGKRRAPRTREKNKQNLQAQTITRGVVYGPKHPTHGCSVSSKAIFAGAFGPRRVRPKTLLRLQGLHEKKRTDSHNSLEGSLEEGSVRHLLPL